MTDRARFGLVALYDIRSGNRVGLFLQPRSPHGANLPLIYMMTMYITKTAPICVTCCKNFPNMSTWLSIFHPSQVWLILHSDNTWFKLNITAKIVEVMHYSLACNFGKSTKYFPTVATLMHLENCFSSFLPHPTWISDFPYNHNYDHNDHCSC